MTAVAIDILTGQDITDAIRYRLTDRQAAVLGFINEYRATKGYPPTLREIGSRFGIRSTNGVNDHLRALERKGAISREDMKSRGIKVLTRPPVLLEPQAAAEIKTARDEVRRLRLLMRQLYASAKSRESWRLDAVAAEISADFALHGESL